MAERDPKLAEARRREEQDAFELYRLAFTDAVVVPSVANFRAAVEAYDELILLIQGTYDGSDTDGG